MSAASGSHELIVELAALERPPCSAGERAAAERIADELRAAGCSRVVVEAEPAHGRYLTTLAGLGLAGSLGALLVARGRRISGAVLSMLAAAGVVDEAQNGPRVLRRLAGMRRRAVNAHGVGGDPDGQRTLIVAAHHDAHWTGRLYDQSAQIAIHRLAPALIERARSSFPQWWLGLAGPALTIVSALSGRRGVARAGLALDLAGTALVADAARSPIAPGANDNLSGVAAVVGLARELSGEELDGLRVWFLSCGAEEALQEGIRAFVARHLDELDPDRTWFLNLETVGSPRLIMLEGEGPIWIEDYAGPRFRDLVERAAAAAGVELDRGYRARASTDSVIPSRAGIATATLTSVTPWGALANYHLPSDVAANVDRGTVDATIRVAAAVARDLAKGAEGPPFAGRSAQSRRDC